MYCMMYYCMSKEFIFRKKEVTKKQCDGYKENKYKLLK